MSGVSTSGSREVRQSALQSSDATGVGSKPPELLEHRRRDSLSAVVQQDRTDLGHHVELIEVDRIPGNRRIGLQRRLAFLAILIFGRIDILQLAAHCIVNDSRPGFICFAEGNGTIVQCRDGMWSHSGGRPGSCSQHGGERRTS